MATSTATAALLSTLALVRALGTWPTFCQCWAGRSGDWTSEGGGLEGHQTSGDTSLGRDQYLSGGSGTDSLGAGGYK